jgi:hypothetical protein
MGLPRCVQLASAAVNVKTETPIKPISAKPDFVLFQSWEPHPVHLLPETDATTFTGVIKAYIDAGG